MRISRWVVTLVLVACGDSGGDSDDDIDTGSDPGPQVGDLEMCGVEGPDEGAGDCLISGGGSFRADFNNDGISDLAIGAPFADVDGVVDAGAVYIVFGGPTFFEQAPQVLTQNMPGTGEQAEAYDRFGWSLSAIDLGRGKSDLIVGVPYEDVGTLRDAGLIQLFVGSHNTGVLAPPAPPSPLPPFITQDTGDVADVAEAGDLFGFSIAWGHLRSETVFALDVAIGAPGEDVDGVVDAGAVHVLFNNYPLTTTGVFLHQGLPGMNAMLEAGDNFGWALAAAQPLIDVDDFQDPTYLVIGVPGEDIGSIVDAGSVHVLPPSPMGPTPTGSQAWHQNSPGIAGGCERGDRFGEVLTTRVTGANDLPDLLVGVPHEDLSGPDGTFAADAGMVHLIPSSGTGLTATGSRVFTQADSSGSPAAETIEAGDMFGSAIAGGRLSDGTRYFVIAAPYEDIDGAINAGIVHYLPQSSGQFPAADARAFGISATPGNTPDSGDLFGFGLSAWDFQGARLIIGVPGKDVVVNGTALGGAGAAFFYSDVAGMAASKVVTAADLGTTPTAREQFGRVMY